MHALQTCIDFEIFGKVSWAQGTGYSFQVLSVARLKKSTFATSDTASCQVIDKTVIATPTPYYNHSVCFRMKKQLLLQREFYCAEQTGNCKEQ